MEKNTAECSSLSHPPTEANWRCEGCAKLFCSDCIEVKSIQMTNIEICRECQGRCVRLPEISDLGLSGVTGSFKEQLGTAIKYPITGRGLPMIISGGIFFFIMDFIMSQSLTGIILFVFVTGYLFSYMLKITSTTAMGKMEPPDWPEFSDFFSSIIEPMFQTFVTFCLCFMVAILYNFIAETPNYMVSIILMILGLFCWPMMWILLALYGSVSNLNPGLIFSSIQKIFGDYILAYLILVLVVFLREVSGSVNSYIPYFGGISMHIIALYFLMFETHILGLLYYCNKEKLDWYGT